jgi:hypothetical protein
MVAAGVFAARDLRTAHLIRTAERDGTPVVATIVDTTYVPATGRRFSDNSQWDTTLSYVAGGEERQVTVRTAGWTFRVPEPQQLPDGQTVTVNVHPDHPLVLGINDIAVVRQQRGILLGVFAVGCAAAAVWLLRRRT